MSLLAKIFIVVVTVLSLVFLGVQATLYYHSNDWREAYERLEQRMKLSVQEKDDEIAKMRGQYSDLEKTKAAVDATLEQIRTVAKATDSALADKQAELNRLQQQYANLENSLKVLGASIDEKDKSIREYTARISTLEENLKTAQSEKELAEAQVARVTSIKVALEKDMGELRKDYTATKQKLLDSQLVLEDLERQGVPVSTLVINHKPLPPIRGKVAGVQSDLVLLTVGKDDKVEKGFPFTVYRGNEFVAKVVVERVMADSAGCRVLFTAAGKNIKPGDDVATVLD
jgi:septal ring factor EnvC (AmiA/AmiB activator)